MNIYFRSTSSRKPLTLRTVPRGRKLATGVTKGRPWRLPPPSPPSQWASCGSRRSTLLRLR